LALVTAALLALALPAFAGAAVTAPHDLLTFPRRDFVSASGYDVTHTYTVEVLHPTSPTPVGTVTGVKPVEDPATPGQGVIEVNHPGGSCWVGTTPDIRAGDTVRITDETSGTADTSLVRDVTTQRPVQTAANTVQRTKVDISQPLDDGYFVNSIKPGDKVVTDGAGLLLAREINPSTEAEE